MRTTIDAAGRIVVPKRLRDELGLEAGQELEITSRDQGLDIEIPPTPMRIRQSDEGPVAEADRPMPVLSADEVRAALERTRR